MYKVKAVHDHYEGLYTSIQSTLCPTEYDMDGHVPSVYITSHSSIYCILAKSHLPNLYLSCFPEDLPTELIRLTIKYIQSRANTTEEQALGHLLE